MKLSRHCVRSRILATAFCSFPDSGLGCCMRPARVQHDDLAWLNPGSMRPVFYRGPCSSARKCLETAAMKVTEPFAND